MNRSVRGDLTPTRADDGNSGGAIIRFPPAERGQSWYGSCFPRTRHASVAVHLTYSTIYLGLAGTLREIAGHLADEVEVPVTTTCCGTAGDRGLLHPELVVSTTREISAVPDARPAEAHLSTNRTYEMGLRHATGRPYESFVFLLEELSRPAEGHGSA